MRNEAFSAFDSSITHKTASAFRALRRRVFFPFVMHMREANSIAESTLAQQFAASNDKDVQLRERSTCCASFNTFLLRFVCRWQQLKCKNKHNHKSDRNVKIFRASRLALRLQRMWAEIFCGMRRSTLRESGEKQVDHRSLLFSVFDPKPTLNTR